MTEHFPGGVGVFETIKTIRGVPFALTRHLARAKRGANILGMSMQSEGELRQEIAAVLLKTPESLECGRLRVSFHKSGEIEITHETYHPWTRPARVTILNRAINEISPLVGIKALPFFENLECVKLAHDSGFDDGLRLNSRGFLAESAVSNVILNVDGRWVTPNLESGCLPGITRGLALEWLEIDEVDVAQDDLPRVQSMYLLSSLKDLQPVSDLGGRSLEIDGDLGKEFAHRMNQDIDP